MIRWTFPVLTILLFTATDVTAQENSGHPLFEQDWLVRLGGQRADADAKFGLANPQLGDIPVLDLGAGDGDTTVNSFWLNVLWQAPDRWSLGFSYFQAEADGERLLDSDFTFGDLTVPAGTGVTGEFTTDFYVLEGFYDFYQATNSSAGIGLGLYALDLGASVQAQIGGQVVGEGASADALAPLPTLSAYFRHAFNDKWAMHAGVGWFSANIDKYDGSILAARVSVDYWFNDQWGLGAGYNYVDLDLTIESDVFEKLYEVQYDSFFIHATFGF